MKSKLKFNMILMEIIFLLIVVGGSTVVYSLFAATYYASAKEKVVQQAFEDIGEIDLSNLGDNDYSMFSSYEQEHLSFTISDSDFNPVYTSTHKEAEGTVRRNIILNLDKFSDDPEVIQRNTRNNEGLRMLGIIHQNDAQYYVCIKETSGSSYSAFYYTVRFLIVVVVLAVLFGSVVMYLMSRRIARPIEHMALASQQLAEHDFSVRVKEKAPYEEVNVLAKNFNNMAEQLQYYVQELEKNNAELEKANTELLGQNEQREKLEKMRQEFSANLSHELKTPLAVISSQVEMLELVTDEEERRYYFGSIHEEIEKMESMIRTLLKMSMAEHKLEELDKCPIDLVETVEYLVMKYDALFRQKAIKRTCRLGQDCLAMADRSCLEQVMSNYMLNAFAHTRAGGSIEITVEREGAQVFFRVYNEGSRIEDDQMDKIWENYYQGSQRENHAGIGLYIVKTVIVLHEGACGVVNKEKGVEFWFSLPAMQKEE